MIRYPATARKTTKYSRRAQATNCAKGESGSGFIPGRFFELRLRCGKPSQLSRLGQRRAVLRQMPRGRGRTADWLWITTDLVKRQQELKTPVSTDRHRPASKGAAFCDNVTSLNPVRPADGLFDPASVGGAERANRMFNCYGWNTLIALFGPPSNERGIPDTARPITDDSPRVWETYKTDLRGVPAHGRDWSLKNRRWNDLQRLPEICRTWRWTAPQCRLPAC